MTSMKCLTGKWNRLSQKMDSEHSILIKHIMIFLVGVISIICSIILYKADQGIMISIIPLIFFIIMYLDSRVSFLEVEISKLWKINIEQAEKINKVLEIIISMKTETYSSLRNPDE